MTRYYYCKDGTDVEGPVSHSDLSRMYSVGILSDTAQICQEGSEAWQSITSIPALPEQPTTPQASSIAPIATANPLLFPMGIVLIFVGIMLGVFFLSSGQSRSQSAKDDVMTNLREGGSYADFNKKFEAQKHAEADFSQTLILAAAVGIGFVGAGVACIVAHNKQKPTP